jgi:hypothetical protein
MARLASPRPWYALGGLLLVLGMFVIDGAAGGVILAVAAVVLLVGIFISLRREAPDERISRGGIIGGL